ncbi:MAG: thiosulfate oxidation carrier complex protein SoxZ [Pseudomonadota bacterium]
MAKPKPRVRVPKKAKKGDIVTIKTLISHKMETGQRKNKKTGEKIPRHIINKFAANFNGKQVFASDWHPAIAANPYMAFSFKAEESGEFEFTWTDDKNETFSKKAKMTVA